MTTLVVRSITREVHQGWVEAAESVSFLQTPEWADVKKEWRSESIGWFTTEGELVGAGLVLYRMAPVIKKSLAYLPEGPDIDWLDERRLGLDAWLSPLVAHVQNAGAFTIKIGVPVVHHIWFTDTIKDAIGTASRLGDVQADLTDNRATKTAEALIKLGWSQQTASEGFGDIQPRYVFTVPVHERTDEQLLAQLNQLWRRNLKKSEKAGVVVRVGDRTDLPAFHEVYVETAKRDHFTPRSLAYFERFWDALTVAPDRIRVYLAEINGEVAAATIWIRVGKHAWYAYGASTTKHRDVRPSNAIQWQMLRDTRDAGAEVYDMRGISDTLNEDDPLFGLIRFKLGIGGQAVEYIGEHDFAINKFLTRAFNLYMSRR